MPERNEPSTWGEYSRLVLAQMETNAEAIKELANNMHVLRGEMNVQLGNLRLQMVQDLSALEKRVGEANRHEVIMISKHFDVEISRAQKTMDDRVGSLSQSFENKIKEMNMTLTNFVSAITKEVQGLRNDVTALQIKAGLWGAGGSILGFLALRVGTQLIGGK